MHAQTQAEAREQLNLKTIFVQVQYAINKAQ